MNALPDPLNSTHPKMQRFAEGWASVDFPGFHHWVQQAEYQDAALHFEGVVGRHALMAADYELAARNAWEMAENTYGERAALLKTLRGIPAARSALRKLNIPLAVPSEKRTKP